LHPGRQHVDVGIGRRGPEQIRQVEVVHRQNPDGHHPGAHDEQRRLDDLHPGCALHAPDQHIQNHQRTHHGDHQRLPQPVIDAKQQRHQTTRARHLRKQVEEAHRESRGRRRHPHRALAQAERQHIGHRELARVTQQFGNQQQRHEPRHEEPDRVQKAVVPVHGDGTTDTQE
jgi:hypothetical protein